MKGLALVLGAPKGGPKPSDGPKSEPAMPAAEEGSGGSEKEFARIASEAIAAGDHEAASDALVSLVKACQGYSSKE